MTAPASGQRDDAALARELAEIIDARYQVVTPDDPHVRLTCAETDKLLRLLRTGTWGNETERDTPKGAS